MNNNKETTMYTHNSIWKAFWSSKPVPMDATDLMGFQGIEGDGFIAEVEDHLLVADVQEEQVIVICAIYEDSTKDQRFVFYTEAEVL